MIDCGGCQDKGSHRRHCPRRPGFSQYTVLADRAQDLGDQIGSNDIVAANAAYLVAGRMRHKARNAGDPSA